MPAHTDHPSLLPGFVRNLMPTTLMGRAMLVGIAVWFVNWVFANDQANTLFGSGLLKQVFDVASVLALVPLGYFGFKATRWVVRSLLWRLRQRLIVTYFLIGVLPLLLVVVLFAALGWVVTVQSSSNLVALQLDGYLEQSQAAAAAISQQWRGADLNQIRRELQDRAEALTPIFPGLTLTVSRSGAHPFTLSVTSTATEEHPQPGKSALQISTSALPLPGWLSRLKEYHGLVFEEDEGERRQVYARHIIRTTDEEPLLTQLSYPIGEPLSAHLAHITGLEVKPGRARISLKHLDESRNEAWPGYPIFKKVTNWQTGEQEEWDALYTDPSFLKPGQILVSLRQFRSQNKIGELMFLGLNVLAAFFLIIASIAVISAAFFTRSITGAVHHLYQGTKRVEAGDLEHEIPTKGQDQLGALAMSFNQMTRSVRELLRVSAEKQRLDQEMNIAAEVQSRLFPRTVPKTETLDLAPGICIPARAVSGDYYDFLDIAPGVIGLVIADVCGKGMSAALLMSNLQASLRGQAQAYRDAWQDRYRIAAATPEKAEALPAFDEILTGRRRVGRIVEIVNRQIENSTSDSRYVTMFYAEIDEQASTLRYTNAGHNAPLLLRRDSAGAGPVIEKLDTGGTVLGLFSNAEYEEGELRLLSGDVLVACTDGVIEAHNPQGEEFGEDRLAAILTRNSHLPAIEIERLILQAVKNWTGGMDQEDDLTLVVLKKK